MTTKVEFDTITTTETTATTVFTNFTVNEFISKIQFSWIDYTLFSTMLALSALIGIYFGFFGKKQDTTEEYLLGGKTMKVFPVSMSLIASHISGLTLLALPADVYRYGAAYWHTCICIAITAAIAAYVFLPVYYKLQLTSTYEYLKLRFDNRMRTITSLLFAINTFLYNPVVIYIPALAFSQATGVHVHLITPIVCSICIFYTTIGGLKAVVWSDTLQFICTSGAMVSVFILGLKASGGFANVWQTSLDGQRLDIFDFDIDPTKRDGFWALTFGQIVHWTAIIAINQGCVQRFLAVPTISDAKKALGIFGVGMCIVKSLSVLTGLIIYTKYHNCDPLATKAVERSDQLLPYYVMDVAHHIPGLSGLFIAGIFSAALSTLSATLNTVAGTIYEDFVAPRMSEKTTEKTASNIIKVIVVISGVVCTALVFVFENLGGLLPLTISIAGITAGPMLGLFILGMLFPSANSKGAYWGGMVGLVGTSIIILTAQYYKMMKILTFPPKPLSTDGCPHLVNATLSSWTSDPVVHQQPFAIFRITHYYYAFIGTAITVIVGLIVSYLTKRPTDPPVNRDYISPVVHFALPKEKPSDYYSVEKAMEMVSQ
ncbi:sodium-coupled monocarboxylate transporter 1-like [Agrilus planipennis]|uniref:Sodium-coupled monocarboxylate transporter 1-like n=1 Tax=Agrilus planipennis TaxID=224129 RepID=A0A1W4XIB1_AGRPL|nr:sodium-coupled monocarboxylate transporter 1-like [Agrilus planipennis]